MVITNDNQMLQFKPTPYKISTITATGSLGSTVDLLVFYENLPIVDYYSTDPGIIFTEFGQKRAETYHRGFHKKMLRARRKEGDKPKRRFDNQTTIILRTVNLEGTAHCVNCKIFRNGNVQMTGVRYFEQGKFVIQTIIDTIKNVHSMFSQVVPNIDDLVVQNYNIQLINSDFRVGFDIMRPKLCNVVRQLHPETFCTYEPSTYPAVKILYHCVNPDNEGESKKITIAAFESGCIIITGAQAEYQIQKAYEFICDIVQETEDYIKKTNLLEIAPIIKERRKAN